MSIEDLQRWDRRHREASALSARDSVLALGGPPHSGALALDFACGQGRHAAALVERGWNVVAADVSRLGLEHARRRVAAGIGRFACVQADADGWPFASAAFDLIVQVDFLDRNLFRFLETSLKPGGVLLIDTFLDQGVANAEGPSSPDFLLTPGELPHSFPGLRVLRYLETRGSTARAEFLAERP